MSIISGLLTSVGETSREALMSKEPTIIVEKLSVNSRCNNIYKKRFITQKKLILALLDIALQPVKKLEIKIQNDSPEIHNYWRDHRHLCCIRFYDTSVVLNFKIMDHSFCLTPTITWQRKPQAAA